MDMDNKDEALEQLETPPVLVSESKQTDGESKRPEIVIPDGGLTAWLQCASSFCLFFNCWGIVNTFGAYRN